MKADIIRIGNSQGVRIPKKFLEECGLVGKIEMNIKAGNLVLAPIKNLREGWDNAFKLMSELGDDALILEETTVSEWDEKEWVW